MDIRKITTVDILNTYKKITQQGNFTKKAFSKCRTLLKGIFDYAVEQGIIPYNYVSSVPLRKLKFQPAKDNSEDVYTEEERSKLLECLRNLPKQDVRSLAIQLAACFPMRIGELRALTWDDYDEQNSRILVWHEIIQQAKGNKKRCDVDVPHTKSGKG